MRISSKGCLVQHCLLARCGRCICRRGPRREHVPDGVSKELRLRIPRTMAQKRNGEYFTASEVGFWHKGFKAMTFQVYNLFSQAHPTLGIKDVEEAAKR